MSMNLHVERTRPATVIVKGKKKQIVDRSSFYLWQTPTIITRAILHSDDQAQAYIDWVNSLSSEYGDNHIAEFRDWIRDSEEEDFTIKFYEF